MIYTVTFNPAIDYVVNIDSLISGKVNRATGEKIFFGGKGINVSLVLNELENETTALGFVAGFTGEALEKSVSSAGVKTDFIKLKDGFTRINVNIKSDSETDINAEGPLIDENCLKQLFLKLDKLQSGDILILAGSIPKSLPEDIYEKILEMLSGRGIEFVVDATKDLLCNVLKYKPFLIKPNNHELGEIFNRKLVSDEEIIECAKILQERGAKNVLVSMAKDGAVLVDENGETHKIGVAKGKTVNSVGAGDSMVAGFVAGFNKTSDYEYALKLGTAAGSATAFSLGLAKKDEIERLFKTL